jgi:hypothetical protein
MVGATAVRREGVLHRRIGDRLPEQFLDRRVDLPDAHRLSRVSERTHHRRQDCPLAPRAPLRGPIWRTGAASWPAGRRLRYANDRSVLLAVDGHANEAKGDSDASDWLPPRSAYRCRYVARQLAIKSHYHLWLTASEQTAIETVLDSCS